MRPEVSREQYFPPEDQQANATAQALYADSQVTSAQLPLEQESDDPTSPAGQILGDFHIDFTPNDGAADFNSNEQDRSRLVDPEMMAELLQTAWKK